MISPGVTYLLSAVAAGLVCGVVCFLFSILHDRAMKILEDRPAPGKLALFAYLLFGVAVMLAVTLPLLFLSKDAAVSTEIIGLIALLTVWAVVQICLSFWFRRRLERRGHVLPGHPWARKSRPKLGSVSRRV